MGGFAAIFPKENPPLSNPELFTSSGSGTFFVKLNVGPPIVDVEIGFTL